MAISFFNKERWSF